MPAPISPSADPGDARELVWGLPWWGNVEFPGLAYCTGGKSVYWGGWCPRLTDTDIVGWPAATRAVLLATYDRVESETGVVPDTDFIFGELQDAPGHRRLRRSHPVLLGRPLAVRAVPAGPARSPSGIEGWAPPTTRPGRCGWARTPPPP